MNSFEDDSIDFLVLENEEGQHSLWPVHLDVPGGWAAVYGPASRTACLDCVEQRWTDLRPKRARTAADGSHA